MKTLMLSKTFPAGHPWPGNKTLFLEQAMSGRKLHTIRKNMKGRYKAGDVVEIRQWSGKPYCSKQDRTGLLFRIGVEPVTLVLRAGELIASVNGIPVSPKRLAANDGLTLDNFIDWFFPGRKPGTFTGDIIHFTSFRYAPGQTAERKQ
jgi:hypothetical protein